MKILDDGMLNIDKEKLIIMSVYDWKKGNDALRQPPTDFFIYCFEIRNVQILNMIW